MTELSPITPSLELVEQWRNQAPEGYGSQTRELWIATQAARWGADQELEACCEWLQDGSMVLGQELRAARRPKPPSLKELALEALDDAVLRGDCITISDALPTIRRALEALPE